MRECHECRWLISITDSTGRDIYLCVDAESGGYLNETGICGNCDLEPMEENNENRD
jgi:hypothetical protein